jgi:hypothetical protein
MVALTSAHRMVSTILLASADAALKKHAIKINTQSIADFDHEFRNTHYLARQILGRNDSKIDSNVTKNRATSIIRHQACLKASIFRRIAITLVVRL